jgi:toxoflavin biosynthesis protein ToxC
VFVVFHHVGSIRGVAAHRDGYIVTAGDDGRVILWDKVAGESVSGSSHNDVVNDCAFSSDGRYLVSSSDDWTARLWSVPDLSLKVVLAGHGDDVTRSAFHPVEELIATASRDYFVRVYDFEARLVAKYDGLIGDVVWLGWTHDGQELAALSGDGQIKRWPWAAQPIDTNSPRGDEHNDYRLVIDPQKSLLACVRDGELGVWDISTPNPVPVAVTILPDDVWARSCAFAGASRLVFRTLGVSCRIYDYLLDKWQTGHRSTDQRQ